MNSRSTKDPPPKPLGGRDPPVPVVPFTTSHALDINASNSSHQSMFVESTPTAPTALTAMETSDAMDSDGGSVPPHHHTQGQLSDPFNDKQRGLIRSDPAGAPEFDEEDEGSFDDEDDDHRPGSGTGAGAESTGRWTRQEHELFLDALKRHGKEWKKVASMVKTRTVVQTRTHAQKYFQKLAKSSGGTFTTSEEVQASAEKLAKKVAMKRASKRSEPSPPTHTASFGALETPQPHSHAQALRRGPAANYYPLETDELTPFAAQIITPLASSMSAPPPPPSYDFFPQPSPAACGKRKHAELQAAEMLAGSAQSSRATNGPSLMDAEGVQTLFHLRDQGAEHRGSTGRRLRAAQGLSLTIEHPDGLGAPASANDPGTPWEVEIQALSAGQARRFSLSSSGSNADLKVSVSTPSEQRRFLSQVRAVIAEGDVMALKALFGAAEASAENHSTSEVVAEGMDESVLAADAEHQPMADGSAARDLIRRSLNKTNSANEQSVLHDAILSDTPAAVVLDMCKLLVDMGASVKATSNGMNTGLHFSARKGLDKVGRLLLAKGCLVNALNADGDAAVHIAARAGHAAFLEMLISLGANFHLRNAAALSPIDLAGVNARDSNEREGLRHLMLTLEPRLRTLVLYHEDFLEHSVRKASDWEAPDRMLQIMRRLADSREFADYEVEISNQFDKGDVVLLGRAHSADYLAFVNTLSKQVQGKVNEGGTRRDDAKAVPFTPHLQRFLSQRSSTEELQPAPAIVSSDTSFSAGTLNAARRAAGAVAYGVDRVLLGRNRNVFCVVRPPGHHAGHLGLLDGAHSCGFCIFNNVAAGALHALEDHHCERVAIVDLDIHHGNGTEDIVRRYPTPSRLLFFSLHLYDEDEGNKFQFYPGTGKVDDHVHNIINVPLQPLWRQTSATAAATDSSSDGMSSPLDENLAGREAYRRAITQRLIPSLRAFNPSLILLSMGFDALSGDVGNCKHSGGKAGPLKGMDLTCEDVAWVTTEVMKIADICCNGRLVSVLEGGYGQYAGNGSRVTSYSTRSSAATDAAGPLLIDADAVETQMNRSLLADAAATHLHRLVDPYPPIPVDHIPTAAASIADSISKDRDGSSKERSSRSSGRAMVPPPLPAKRP